VVGPNDSYLVQADRDDTKFWAHKNQQALGCNFRYVSDEVSEEMKYKTDLTVEEWKENVESGFQILPQQLLGRVEGHDGSQGGVLPGQGEQGFCEFDFSVEPLCGWGSQKSTGGWLASYDVFEPHWQVTLAGTYPFVLYLSMCVEQSDAPVCMDPLQMQEQLAP
jgi:tocopherol cyclase